MGFWADWLFFIPLALLIYSLHALVCAVVRALRYKNRLLVDLDLFKGCMDIEAGPRRFGLTRTLYNDSTQPNGRGETSLRLVFRKEECSELQQKEMWRGVKLKNKVASEFGLLSCMQGSVRPQVSADAGKTLYLRNMREEYAELPEVQSMPSIGSVQSITNPDEEQEIQDGHGEAQEGVWTFDFSRKAGEDDVLDAGVFKGQLALQASRLTIRMFNNHLALLLADVLCYGLSLILLLLRYDTSGDRRKEKANEAMRDLFIVNTVVWVFVRLGCLIMTPWLETSCVVDATNSIAQRNGLVYKKDVRNKAMSFHSSHGQGSLRLPYVWHSFVWMAPNTDPRQERWCKEPGLGIQFSNAIESHEEAIKHMDGASSLVYLMCGIYTLGVIAVCMLKRAGSYPLDYPGTLVSIITGILTVEITTAAGVLINFACSTLKEKRAIDTCTYINNGALLVDETKLKEMVTRSNNIFNFVWGLCLLETRPTRRVWGNLKKRHLLFNNVDGNMLLLFKVAPTHSHPRRHFRKLIPQSNLKKDIASTGNSDSEREGSSI